MTTGAERPPYGTRQRKFSPFSVHFSMSPVSREIPSRVGPTHLGPVAERDAARPLGRGRDADCESQRDRKEALLEHQGVLRPHFGLRTYVTRRCYANAEGDGCILASQRSCYADGARGLLLTLACVAALAAGRRRAIRPGADWPQWRGPDRTGCRRRPRCFAVAAGRPALLWTAANLGAGYGSSAVERRPCLRPGHASWTEHRGRR